jgi:hypothetical protein
MHCCGVSHTKPSHTRGVTMSDCMEKC